MTENNTFRINIDGEPTKTYICSNRHTWKGDHLPKAYVSIDGQYMEHPYCPFCYIEWFKQNISECMEKPTVSIQSGLGGEVKEGR